jgi:hypothetical protein
MDTSTATIAKAIVTMFLATTEALRLRPNRLPNYTANARRGTIITPVLSSFQQRPVGAATLLPFFMDNQCTCRCGGKGRQVGKIRLGMAISAVLAMTSPVLAYTGAELADSCAIAPGGFCMGYIVVIGQVSPAVCPPVGSIHGQGQRVAVQFLKDHPERLREPALFW